MREGKSRIQFWKNYDDISFLSGEPPPGYDCGEFHLYERAAPTAATSKLAPKTYREREYSEIDETITIRKSIKSERIPPQQTAIDLHARMDKRPPPKR